MVCEPDNTDKKNISCHSSICVIRAIRGFFGFCANSVVHPNKDAHPQSAIGKKLLFEQFPSLLPSFHRGFPQIP